MWEPLFRKPAGVVTRWASSENPSAEKSGACRNDDGRKRNACICPLRAGETATLLEVNGTPGCIRRIWSTIADRSPNMLRSLRLEMTWDGADRPAVSVPFGDFFCHPLGQMSPFENALFSSPEGRSFNCCVPMPFRSGARITVTNETDRDLKMFFYDVDLTLGDSHPDDMLYFHAHWRRENPTRAGTDFTVLPEIQGAGRFLGVCFGVRADMEKYFRSWWGEGEWKAWIDGDTTWPTLCGTGTEDYIGTAWGQGRFTHAFQGCPIADEERMRYGFYRLHVPDPVWFDESIRVTMQQIGCWNPEAIRQMRDSGISLRHADKVFDMKTAAETIQYGFFEREDDWSSCAWFYLNRPVTHLPELQALGERQAGMELPTGLAQALA